MRIVNSTLIGTFCLVTLVSGSVCAQSQPTSEKSSATSQSSAANQTSKQQLIKEMLITARAVQNAEMGFNLVLDQMARGSKTAMADRIQRDPKLTAEEKAEALRKSLVYLNSHMQRLKQLANQKIDVPKLVTDTYVPLYDKYFDQAEIQAMLDWYKSPTGQKSLDLLPQITGEATKSINAIIMPKLKEITDEMEAEDKAGKIGSPNQ